jgi:integrase
VIVSRHALRLSAVRGFAAWLNAADPAHQVPPRRLIPYGSRAVVPYLYSDEEITALAREAGRLSGRLRAATFQALIRLLAVTGMFSAGHPLLRKLISAFAQLRG